MVLAALTIWSALAATACLPIRLHDDLDTCVRFDKRHDDGIGDVLAVEVRAGERIVDRFVVPTHYGKARGEVVTVARDGASVRQAISIVAEGGTGTGYLEMMWLLVDLDDKDERLVARIYEPVSGHIGSLHTQTFTTTTTWKPREHRVQLTQTWRAQIGAPGASSLGSGSMRWTTDLVCVPDCYRTETEQDILDDEGMVLPRRRIARARVWLTQGSFDLHNPATWRVSSLFVDDVSPSP